VKTFETKAIGWSHVTFSFNSLPTAAPERLVPRALPQTLYLGAFVVMSDKTTAIVIFHIEIAFMTANAMKRRRRSESVEEIGREEREEIW